MIISTQTINELTGFQVDNLMNFNFESFTKHLQFKKDENLPDSILRPENFTILAEGVILLYWLEDNNNKILFDFKRKGEALRPVIEIDKEKCGKIYAKCLTPVSLLSFERDRLCTCTFDDIDIANFYYGLLTQDLSSTYQQLKLLKEASIEKRYESFLREFGDIHNLISDRMIANYLGVHYTTLARMKVRLLEKEKNNQ